MEKKIMLAVDDSKDSTQAVDYAVRMSSKIRSLHYVLFYIQPMISQYIQDEAKESPAARSELAKILEKNEKKAQDLLNGCKNKMVQMGIDQERIEIFTYPRRLGVAKDIIDFAQERHYDAIVIGRRGLSKMQELIMGSVTSELIEHSRMIPVWVVDGKISSSKILVAVDDSEYSLRAVDHVSFMAGDNKTTYLTFYHIKPKGADMSHVEFDEKESAELEKIVARHADKFVNEFHEKAVRKLKEAGIDEDRYEIRVADTVRNVGKAIVDKASQEDFGTIVIGRSGMNKSFFMGSVSRYVINKAMNRALWVVS
jgi:nucleotide-binding universal stress UspA family protein